MAVDFAKLPELLKRTSARGEVGSAASQHEPPSRAQAQNGRHTARQLDRLSDNPVQRPKILQPVRHQNSHQGLVSNAR
jgi:hypothetical protein